VKLIGCWVAAGLAFVPAASAAFPGRDGLLAVTPAAGHGVLLVNAHGAQQRRICANVDGCGTLVQPRWSADGRALTFTPQDRLGALGTTQLVYPDGSCLNCQITGNTVLAAFTPTPGLLTAIADGRLVKIGSDGVIRATLTTAGVADAVSSVHGELAVVDGAGVLVGYPGHLKPIGPGSDPSWSPGGGQLVIVRGDRLAIVNAGTRRVVRRLVTGAAPAWSPNGHSIAFIGRDDDVEIVPVSGGKPRRVGTVRGLSVDWQPIPKHAPAGCVAPPGSKVIASSESGVVTAYPIGSPGAIPGPSAVMGCLRTSGDERLLELYHGLVDNDSDGVSEAAAAGTYGAVVSFDHDLHYGGEDETATVYDLATGGESPTLGGESIDCPDYGPGPCAPSMDDLVANSSGYTAVHTVLQGETTATEQILASDSTGVHILDSTPPTTATSPALSNLALTGNTLTWENDGAPRSAQLN
jgi:hypothetical protein